jgi:hypothetical protein
MANELDYSFGVDVTLTFEKANPGASATTALTFSQGGAGFKVPTGYAFHPICLHGESNADLTGGTATFKVTSSGTALSNGPTAALSDTIQAAVGVQRVGVEPIAAGAVVGVSVVTDGSYAPTTADLDAVLIGKLLPA